ncbi:MAG: helix-turn-helix domain-containing protein [Candidatus Margulisiibacteriota bacterium]
MAFFDELKRRQIEEALKKAEVLPLDKLGRRIKDIREILGMTQAQMAKRLGIKQPTLSKIEDNIESSKLKTVLDLCRAINCEFMGAIVLKGSIKKMIEERALGAAKKILKRTHANMALEKQAPSGVLYSLQLKKLVTDLISNPGPELWED